MKQYLLTKDAQTRTKERIDNKANTSPLPVNLRYYSAGELTPLAHISFMCPHCKDEGRCLDGICYKCGRPVEYPICKVCGEELKRDYFINLHKCWEDKERVTAKGGLTIFDLDKHQIAISGQFKNLLDFLGYLISG